MQQPALRGVAAHDQGSKALAARPGQSRLQRHGAARKGPAHRLARAVQDSERVVVSVESNADGTTVTYRFGLEEAALAAAPGPLPVPGSAAASELAAPFGQGPKANGSTGNGAAAAAAANGLANGAAVAAAANGAVLAHEQASSSLVVGAAAAAGAALAAQQLKGGLLLGHAPAAHPQSHAHDSAAALDSLVASAALPASNGSGDFGDPVGSGREGRATDARSLDYSAAQSGSILRLYNRLCEAERLDDALYLVRECIRGNRTDVLMKLKHFKFLRPAARCKAVKHALRFIQLMPRQYVDSRTYNMVISVCARAGDLKNALHAADMLQMAGLKLDTILYTNLIKACAAAGNAERAFELYGNMREAGLQMEKQVYCALISACTEQIQRTHAEDRRTQLVLLERALGVLGDMKKARVPADAAVWNAMVSAAGKAGQLQRAFNVVEEMLSQSAKPNARTYASLIDACARAGDKELALRVYRKALREGSGSALQIYSSAVNACANDKHGADVQAAMEVYKDLQRNSVRPDSTFFGHMMVVAGKAGAPALAMDLQHDMEAEGLEPCQGTHSALLTVYVHEGKLDEAGRLYRRIRECGGRPHRHAMNALINAYGNQHRLGDVVTLVADAMEDGMKPDPYTFSAILNACLKADECELAIDVYKLMKQRNMSPDDTHTQQLLWMCCTRLKQEADGVEPRLRRVQERSKLLQALTLRGRAPPDTPADVPWLSQAFAIYRDVVGGNRRPSMAVLNLVLTCLQVPYESNRRMQQHSHPLPEGIGALTGHMPAPAPPAAPEAQRAQRQQKIGVETVFHVQAISILEEAMLSGVVPSFMGDASRPVDLRALPPAVGAAYACTVISALQRQVDARQVLQNPLIFQVPPFDPASVFRPRGAPGPSEAAQAEGEGAAEAQGARPEGAARWEGAGTAARGSVGSVEGSGDDLDEWLTSSEWDSDEDMFTRYGANGGEEGAGDTRTGLGVAGALRRMRLYTREFGEAGLIVVEPRELMRWAKLQARLAETRSAGALPVQKPYGQPRPLAEQQRNIRLGW